MTLQYNIFIDMPETHDITDVIENLSEQFSGDVVSIDEIDHDDLPYFNTYRLDDANDLYCVRIVPANDIWYTTVSDIKVMYPDAKEIIISITDGRSYVEIMSDTSSWDAYIDDDVEDVVIQMAHTLTCIDDEIDPFDMDDEYDDEDEM